MCMEEFSLSRASIRPSNNARHLAKLASGFPSRTNFKSRIFPIRLFAFLGRRQHGLQAEHDLHGAPIMWRAALRFSDAALACCRASFLQATSTQNRYYQSKVQRGHGPQMSKKYYCFK